MSSWDSQTVPENRLNFIYGKERALDESTKQWYSFGEGKPKMTHWIDLLNFKTKDLPQIVIDIIFADSDGWMAGADPIVKYAGPNQMKQFVDWYNNLADDERGLVNLQAGLSEFTKVDLYELKAEAVKLDRDDLHDAYNSILRAYYNA